MSDTLPKLLARHAAQRGSATALREKRLGIWQETSWTRLHDDVRALALGLVALGLRRGARVAIEGANRPAWLCAELAAQAAGASIGGDAAFTIAERGKRHWEVTRPGQPAIALEAVLEKGRSQDPALHAASVERGLETDLAVGPLSHRELLAAARGLPGLRAGDEVVCCEPLSTAAAQVGSVAVALGAGLTVNFPESAATLHADLREIGPHVLHAPPGFWDDLHASVQAKLARTTRFNQFAYRRLLRPSLLSGLLLHAPLKDRLGLTRVHSAGALGASPSTAALEFFRAIGLPLPTTPLPGAA